ncbi:MAG: alanine--tRNA ligase [Cyanobacteria bacterium SZAS LIN-3]|nr:alanine--tRNA ligase [Cyanobacteria bacterium SZAS LIN-3]
MTLRGAEIRDKFVSYFRDKRGHKHIESSSLIPDNPTLLLTSAGMVQFVPIFLGQAKAPEPPRAVTVQKCARAGGKDSDIENIGRTSRHHSFFEMLGNFSFGDYFKKEVIPWAWEFVTKDLGLEPEKLHVTVFKGDEHNPFDGEAYDIWNKVVGVPQERIYKMSRKDNFWGPPGPTGPCGPCSEIYYDRGPTYGCSDDPTKCGIGLCDCDRYLEFWNLVFMELFKDEHGKFTPLDKKNVDTGSGLERVALILQNKHNTFETDLFYPIIEKVVELSGVKYTGGVPPHPWNATQESRQDSFIKIIADHTRAVTFLVADGVRTSNIGRGYVLRFITRRAARFGRLLGINEPFVYKLVPTVIDIYGDFYPELKKNQEQVIKHIREEEERFARTIDKGMIFLEELLAREDKEVPGAEAFNLYATYGFPIELTTEMALEHGKKVDMEAFATARKQHEEVSSVNKFNVIMTGEEALGKVVKEKGPSQFTGYSKQEDQGQIVALLKDGKPIEEALEGEEVEIILDRTPFYAESGGQLADTGILENDDARLMVLDVKKHEGLHIHKVRSLSGTVTPGTQIKAIVDKARRTATMLHHSTAHVFHSAIREIFGKHVTQAGSQVGPNAMRFDFSLDKQPSKDEIMAVENLMNEWVRQNDPVKTQEMGIDEAKKTGAIAMFGEKYGDVVRVVSMGDFSLEFCGGTHVANTGDIGQVKIISEGSVASGVRRIEAISGPRAWNYISDQLKYLGDASERLKVKPAELASQIERIQNELKQREKQLAAMEEKLALSKVDELIASARAMGDKMVIAQVVPNMSPASLKSIAENIKAREGNNALLLVSPQGQESVSIVSAFSPSLVKRGFNAGKIVSEVAQILGGKGGGRPDFAQAGGKEPGRASEAVSKFWEIVEAN